VQQVEQARFQRRDSNHALFSGGDGRECGDEGAPQQARLM